MYPFLPTLTSLLPSFYLPIFNPSPLNVFPTPNPSNKSSNVKYRKNIYPSPFFLSSPLYGDLEPHRHYTIIYFCIGRCMYVCIHICHQPQDPPQLSLLFSLGQFGHQIKNKQQSRYIFFHIFSYTLPLLKRPSSLLPLPSSL